MTPLPKPTIQQAVNALSDRDEFKAIIQFIQDERERFFADLRQCVDTNEVMKVVGSVSTLDELLSSVEKRRLTFQPPMLLLLRRFVFRRVCVFREP
jgi:hypothetical protein